MEGYVIKTHLKDKPEISFYYKGTADEDGVSFAMNTIVGFDITDAMVIHDKESAVQLCKKLDKERESLLKNGYGSFIIQSSRSGNESFLTYFRFLSSHTTVRAVRHTAVWLAFKVAIYDHLPSLLISAAD